MDKRQEIQNKYRPQEVRYLFVAEAYPCTEGQFFYYENVATQDNLFMYVIRAVFPELKSLQAKEIRSQKAALLQRFCDEGYFLDYSVAASIPKEASAAQSARIVKDSLDDLLVRVAPYKASANIILISAAVYKYCIETLLTNGFTVLNTQSVPYPGSGQQGKFTEAIFKLGF